MSAVVVDVLSEAAVFPLEPRGKVPYDGLGSWKAKSRPRDQWKAWPEDANTGIDCGKSGLVVLDEDEPGAVQRWLGYVPVTYTVRTGKGRHFYFRAPENVTVRDSIKKVAPGVDVKANGYVVGPGSVHPNGTAYQVVVDGALAALPAEVLQALTAPGSVEVDLSTSSDPVRLPDHPVGEGGRNATLFRFACSLVARMPPIREDEALVLLRQAYDQCEPPYTDESPDAMLARAIREYGPGPLIEVEGLRVRKDEYERVRAQRLVWRLADQSAQEQIEEAEVAAMPDKWLLGDAVLDIAAVSPIWGPESSPWTASGQQTLIVGPDSTGKSTLSTHYGKARLNLPGWGGLLLGEPVVPLPEDQSMLYLAADRPIQIMEGFKRGLTEEMRDQLHKRLWFWPGPPPMDLSTRAGRMWLLRKVEQTNAGLVFIDSRKDVGDVLDNREVNRLNRLLKELDAEGVEVVMPHHNIQSADPPSVKPDLTHVMGLREVFSGTGSVLMIKGKKGSAVVTLHQVKPIREMHEPVRVRLDKTSGRVEVADPIAQADPQDPNAVNLDLSECDEAGEDTYGQELRERLREAGTDGVPATLLTGSGEEGKAKRRRLARLAADGEAVVVPKNRSKVWYLAQYAPPS